MKYVDEFFIMLNEDTIFRTDLEGMKLEVWMRLRFCWMDEWLCSSTHNKDDVEALDKCAPLARFISFVPMCVVLILEKQVCPLYALNQ